MESSSKFLQKIIETDKFHKELCESKLDKYLWNIKNPNDKFDIEFNLYEEFNKSFNKYCNIYGKSDTRIGEIIRGLSKLMYRYNNDGDDICCGPYSGIWYGLKNALDCLFSFSEESVEYCGYDYDNLNCFGYALKDYCSNIMLNALILETFEYYHRSNSIDISDYYTSIVNLIMPQYIVKKFLDNGIDITNNFGCYSNNAFRFYDSVEINSINEEIYITYNDDVKMIEFVFSNCFGHVLNLKFKRSEIDMIMKDYKDLFKYLIDNVKNLYKLYENEFIENIKKLGYIVDSTQYIVKENRKDVNWAVNFEVTVNGEEVKFDDLTDSAKEYILNCIKEDDYSGTF